VEDETAEGQPLGVTEAIRVTPPSGPRLPDRSQESHRGRVTPRKRLFEDGLQPQEARAGQWSSHSWSRLRYGSDVAVFDGALGSSAQPVAITVRGPTNRNLAALGFRSDSNLPAAWLEQCFYGLGSPRERPDAFSCFPRKKSSCADPAPPAIGNPIRAPDPVADEDGASTPAPLPSLSVPFSLAENRSSSARSAPTRHANGTYAPSVVDRAAHRQPSLRRSARLFRTRRAACLWCPQGNSKPDLRGSGWVSRSL
jgi:hypothetical protein